MLNNVRLRTQPCFTPIEEEKVSDILLSIFIQNLTEEYMSIRIFKKLPPIPDVNMLAY